MLNRSHKAKFWSAIACMLSLYTTLTLAEESSILEGASIANPDDFQTSSTPDPDIFF